eukprot:XP_001700804.1 predicted protein [Chlamydomonas reinhardtii]
MPHQAMPYSDGYGGYGYGGGSGVGPMVPPALSGGGGGWYGNGYGYNVAMAAQPVTPEPGIDPGVAMVGAVRNVHVVLQPRSTVRQELALMFVQPGLYQLYVYDVAVVPEGADAGLWAGRPGQAPQPQRVYASVDRLHDSPVFYSGTGFHKLCGGSTVIEKVPSRPDKPPGQAITGCDHCGRPFVFSIALNGLKVPQPVTDDSSVREMLLKLSTSNPNKRISATVLDQAAEAAKAVARRRLTLHHQTVEALVSAHLWTVYAVTERNIAWRSDLASLSASTVTLFRALPCKGSPFASRVARALLDAGLLDCYARMLAWVRARGVPPAAAASGSAVPAATPAAAEYEEEELEMYYSLLLQASSMLQTLSHWTTPSHADAHAHLCAALERSQAAARVRRLLSGRGIQFCCAWGLEAARLCHYKMVAAAAGGGTGGSAAAAAAQWTAPPAAYQLPPGQPLVPAVQAYDALIAVWPAMLEGSLPMQIINPFAGVLTRLLMELRPRQAAARLPALWRVVAWALPQVDADNLHAAGELLRLLLAGPDGSLLSCTAGRAGTASAGQVPGSGGPSYSLRCGLDARLLPELEELVRDETALRKPEGEARSAPTVLSAVNLTLRYSGVWPALLAHASPAEAAGLVATLGSAARFFLTHNTPRMRPVALGGVLGRTQLWGAEYDGVSLGSGEDGKAPSRLSTPEPDLLLLATQLLTRVAVQQAPLLLAPQHGPEGGAAAEQLLAHWLVEALQLAIRTSAKSGAAGPAGKAQHVGPAAQLTYCCSACQLAHWREGHDVACAGLVAAAASGKQGTKSRRSAGKRPLKGRLELVWRVLNGRRLSVRFPWSLEGS